MTPQAIKKFYEKEVFSYKKSMHYLMLIGFTLTQANDFLHSNPL